MNNPETWEDELGIVREVPTGSSKGWSKTAWWRRIRRHVIRRDGGECKTCGAVEANIIDHILPRRDGGSHHPDNLRLLCARCHGEMTGGRSRAKRVDREEMESLLTEARELIGSIADDPDNSLAFFKWVTRYDSLRGEA